MSINNDFSYLSNNNYGGRVGRRMRRNKNNIVKGQYFLIYFLTLCLLVSLLFNIKGFKKSINISDRIQDQESTELSAFSMEEASNSSKSGVFSGTNEELQQLIASDDISWCFLDLKTGEKVGNNIDKEMQIASLSKLSVLYVVMSQIKEDKMDWEDEIVFKSEDYTTGSGILQETIEEGDSYSIRELCRLLLEKSDNISYRMLMRTIGQDVVKEKLNAEGMSIRFDDGNYMSASSVALLLKKIWELVISGKNNFAEVLGWMASSSYRNGIPAALSSGCLAANKEGNISGSVLADSAIILAPCPYILVIITNGIDDDEGYGIIHSITETFNNKDLSFSKSLDL
ncbi:MAG: D-alanyl-D-alanine carboxypeptidase [Pelotomaculum sp. PtaU1.Bin035]|nr:MAG: D-alanyl-D-alanine carboxypeptidase [Pelotomaculum sp. PtaU1.Bin035]